MSDYLLPESNLSIDEKVTIFSLRTEMNNLPCNYGKPEICYFGCQEAMSNEHIILCPVVNLENPHTLKYEYLLNGNITEKIEALNKFKGNDKIFSQQTSSTRSEQK